MKQKNDKKKQSKIQIEHVEGRERNQTKWQRNTSNCKKGEQ